VQNWRVYIADAFAKEVAKIMEMEEIYDTEDVGQTSFAITYDDGSKDKRAFFTTEESFESAFSSIFFASSNFPSSMRQIESSL